MEQKIYNAYIDILKEELLPAMGCTEPIAVAYAGALARKALGALPERVELCVSGNIIKNVKSVIVPHTGGRKGLKVAVAVGLCCGDPEAELEVISGVTEQQLRALDAYLEQVQVQIIESTANCAFDIQVTAHAGNDTAYARIIGHHTNVVSLKKNDTVLLEVPFDDDVVQAPENRKLLSWFEIILPKRRSPASIWSRIPSGTIPAGSWRHRFWALWAAITSALTAWRPPAMER